jgi:hypothetical protein
MAGFSVWPAIIGFSVLCFGMSQGTPFLFFFKKKRKHH